MALPLPTSKIPRTLADYTLLTKLASGGMATVYVARKRGVGGFERLVAIKLCHPHLRDNEEFVAMFLDEARLAASIRHPNVVGTLDVSDGELLYQVMEYVEGASLGKLNKHVATTGELMPPGVALRIMIDTLTGLHAAHELRDSEGRFLNLVHRDVSPQNILLSVDGVTRITDFGIAFASARSTQTQEGRIKGKFSYLAPEQVRGHPASRRMDIFAAGIVLWESLTGKSLFRRQDDAATIHAVMTEPIVPPSRLVPGLPEEVDEVVLKALQRNPDERYQTAADFAEALDRLPVPGKTARAVAEHLGKVFGPALAERREQIKNAPEQMIEAPSASRETNTGSVSTSLALPQALPTIPPSGIQSVGADDIEHRRIRGLMAAAMLLLVGSALGLLLARSGPETSAAPAAAPPAPPAAPASASVHLPSPNEKATTH